MVFHFHFRTGSGDLRVNGHEIWEQAGERDAAFQFIAFVVGPYHFGRDPIESKIHIRRIAHQTVAMRAKDN
jgi:hypothetical protein